MDGMICVHKPEGWTSFDVVAKMRGIAQTKKVGHAGTLDPMATGVLPLFLGIATKACDVLPGEDKAYRANFRLGETTTTQDRTGEVETTCESAVTRAEIEAMLPQFTGEIEQIPPMYSAVQINGKRLYDLARAGQVVERKPRHVTIYGLELLSFDEETQTGVLDVHCTKGTYIRTLVHDLGQALGVGAVLTDLLRYQAGNFTLNDCYTIEELQRFREDGTLADKVLPLTRVFAGLPKIHLNPVQSRKFCHGVKLDLRRVRYENKDGLHQVFAADGQFLGLATLRLDTMELVVAKMFYR